MHVEGDILCVGCCKCPPDDKVNLFCPCKAKLFCADCTKTYFETDKHTTCPHCRESVGDVIIYSYGTIDIRRSKEIMCSFCLQIAVGEKCDCGYASCECAVCEECSKEWDDEAIQRFCTCPQFHQRQRSGTLYVNRYFLSYENEQKTDEIVEEKLDEIIEIVENDEIIRNNEIIENEQSIEIVENENNEEQLDEIVENDEEKSDEIIENSEIIENDEEKLDEIIEKDKIISNIEEDLYEIVDENLGEDFDQIIKNVKENSYHLHQMAKQKPYENLNENDEQFIGDAKFQKALHEVICVQHKTDLKSLLRKTEDKTNKIPPIVPANSKATSIESDSRFDRIMELTKSLSVEPCTASILKPSELNTNGKNYLWDSAKTEPFNNTKQKVFSGRKRRQLSPGCNRSDNCRKPQARKQRKK